MQRCFTRLKDANSLNYIEVNLEQSLPLDKHSSTIQVNPPEKKINECLHSSSCTNACIKSVFALK